MDDTPPGLTDGGKRILAKKGREFLVFRMEEISYFFIENGMSYLIERKTNYKYIMARPLRNIEMIVSPEYFFRATKKYLVHIDAVVKFRPAKGGKLELLLSPDPGKAIVISQLKAQHFKRWLLKN